MQNSLILQSRELIEKLSQKNIGKIKIYKENNKSFDDLLTNEDNIRNRDDVRCTHKLSDSLPKSTVTSILSRSAYMSKSVDRLSNVSSNTDVSDLCMPRRIPFGMSTSAGQIRASSDKYAHLKNLDLLGYDWIAGMMENKAKEAHLDQPPHYFEELERFRRQNKEFCISSENRFSTNIANVPQRSEYKQAFNGFNYTFQSNNMNSTAKYDENHPEVYAYTLNERLFPIPLDMDTAERGAPDPNNPHIIKISIPSNRFVHRNQRIQTMKEKVDPHNFQQNDQSVGESLSLSSHCQFSRNITASMNTCKTKTFNNTKSSHQEPASLRGHILMDSAGSGTLLPDSMSPFGGNQPKNQQEAIDQLQRGKIGAKSSRMIPSVLEKRSLNIDLPIEPMNICQTRITLKDMDDSLPRHAINKIKNGVDFSLVASKEKSSLTTDVPRASLSRLQMSKLYGDAMRNVWENAD